MSMNTEATQEEISIHFTCGGIDKSIEGKDTEEIIRTFIRDRFHQKNVYFLFGSGTSVPALPLMKGLYEQVEKLFSETDENPEKKEEDTLFNKAKQQGDLEKTLGILYSLERYQEGIQDDSELKVTQGVIRKIQNHIYKTLWHPTQVDLKGNQPDHALPNPSKEKRGKMGHQYRSTLDTYKAFYQKVVYRNKDLSRIHIFTTNNDLFNEAALDELGILYTNGFTPGLQRFFNPALFNFTYSKRMDVSIDKYEPIDNMVYLYKLHGSVNWQDLGATDSSNKLFSIQEVYPNAPLQSSTDADNACLVYPAPTKQNLSLGSPYVDLIRLFQEKLLEHNSVLFVCGYSFSDEHINNVIYRALAVNASLNLVILNDLGETHALRTTKDARIYNIWSESTKEGECHIHYFSEVVNKLLTALDLDKSDTIQEQLVENYTNYIRGNK
jgi:hypothetical protein